MNVLRRRRVGRDYVFGVRVAFSSEGKCVGECGMNCVWVDECVCVFEIVEKFEFGEGVEESC